MNYSQEELKELQAIHGLKDNELGTRQPTEQEFQAFNATIQELWEKGFVVSKDNFLKLWLAFDANPQIPITRGNILETTKVYRDNYTWKSTAEQEFRKLSEQIGPDQTALVTRELGRHGLVNIPGTEDMFNNFNLVVSFYLSRGWTISADSFEKAIGSFHAVGGSRFTTHNLGTLVYKPTRDQLAAAKRWENTRQSEPNTEYKNFTKTTKSPLQIAKEKAEAAKHVMLPDGRRMSDVIMQEFYENHPEALETDTPAQTSPVSPEDFYEAYWKRQTKEYIQHMASTNIQIEADAEVKKVYDQQKSWRAAYSFLHNWYGQRAPGVIN